MEPTAVGVAPSATQASADSDKVQIRGFVGLGTGTEPPQVAVQEAVVEEFNASHPNIELVLEVVAYDAARDALATQVASGNPPDIVGPVGVQGSEAFHGQWLDLTSLIEAADYDLSQFGEGAVEFYNVGGEGQLGLPFAIFPSALFYHRDLFDEAGLSYPPHEYGEPYVWADGTEAEWNYETLRELAMLLTVDEQGRDATDPEFDPTTIVQYGFEPQWLDLRAIGSYFGAGSLVADDGETAQIPPEWEEAWRWLYNGIWEDHFIADNAVRNSEEFGSDNVFGAGRGAMALTHLWYTCCASDAMSDWDVAVVPSHNGETTANFNADTFRIHKDTEHPEEAFEVLTYLIGEASLELLEVYGGMPARTADQEAYLATLEEENSQGVDWQVFIDSIAYADKPSFESFMPNINEALDRTNVFLSALMSEEGLDLDAELAQFEADLQAIFERAQ
jgi:multiple sugar transport system substrate-binding protein